MALHRPIAWIAGGIVTLVGLSCGRQPYETPLKAVVLNHATSFAMRNNDSFDWRNCDLDLNSAYSIKGISILAGTTYSAAAREFLKKDGTRFDFASIKPQTLLIYCRDTPSGARSTLVGWK
jgi:hypothetical protein